jgi:outer membrane immunogenic protein
MRKALSALAGVGLLASGPLFAADLAVKAPLYKAPAPVFSWTGCYVGANAGGAWASSTASDILGGDWLTHSPAADNAAVQANGSPSFSTSGFAGGGQFGCNYQINQFVLGVEGDADYLGLSSSASSSVLAPVAGTTVTNSASLSSHWLTTVRPRLGYTTGPALFYATGGLAVGNVSYSDTQSFTASNSAASGSVSSTRTGYAVGGGIEYAFDNHWIGGVEYLHVDLGSLGFNTTVQPGFSAFSNSFSADFKENIVRARLNYKF